jgi:hypothetical protein
MSRSKLRGFTARRSPGCAAVEASGEDGVVRVTGLVEKPPREDGPSHTSDKRTVVRLGCDRSDPGPEFVT